MAIFSDVHGNLSGLDAVLAEVQRAGPVDRVVCAGDVAVFGPAPAEAIDRLRAAGIATVRGNTDDWLVQAARGGGGPEADPPRAHVAWALAQLAEDHRAWLEALPPAVRVSPGGGSDPRADLVVVHATPRSCHDDVRLCAPGLPAAEARQVFGTAGAAVVAFGHRHGAFVAPYGDLTLVNVSSVSITPDGAAAATLALFTWHGDHWSVELRRVPYDPGPELERARRRGMPPHPWWTGLEQRLAGGSTMGGARTG